MMHTSRSPGSNALEYFATRFGIDANACDGLLNLVLERGGDYADLFFEYSRQRMITFEDQVVRGTSSGIVQGLGVRVVVGDAVGYAYTEQLDIESMREAARLASNIARGAAAQELQVGRVHAVPVADRYPVELPSIDEPAATTVALLRRADEATRAVAPSVTHVHAWLADQIRHIVVATSEGRLAGDTQPMVSLAVQAFSLRGSDRQQGTQGKAARAGVDFFGDGERTPEAIGRRAAERAILGHDAVEAPAGFLPVVLAAGESGVWLHEAVGHGLEGDFNRKRWSNYSDRIGQSVASPLCTVVDDGTIPILRGSINVDDEGQDPQYNVLIEGGVLSGYMQDWISARHFGVAPSGNGRRQDFRNVPMPRMTTTYMLPGESSPDDIIRAVKRGVYCVSFSGGQVDISSGDYVFSTEEAYLIEDGRVTAPIRTTNLIGNGPDSLTRVKMVGHDLKLHDGVGTCGKRGQWVPVSLGLPTVLVDGITVGGTK